VSGDLYIQQIPRVVVAMSNHHPSGGSGVPAASRQDSPMVDEMFDEHVAMMEVEDAQSSSVGGGPHLNLGSGGGGAGANGGSAGNGGPMQQANALLAV